MAANQYYCVTVEKPGRHYVEYVVVEAHDADDAVGKVMDRRGNKWRVVSVTEAEEDESDAEIWLRILADWSENE